MGVRAMDDQHGVLMDTLNDLRQAATRGAGRERVRDEMRRLVEFTGMHFASEERLLDQHGFPGAAEHRAAHEHLLDQIRRLLLQAEHAGETELQTITGVLRGWFVEHIEQLDRTYGDWLNERGIS